MPKLVRLVAQRDARVSRHDLAVRPDGREDDEMRAGALRRRRRDSSGPKRRENAIWEPSVTS
jgi:hypothetical protein